MKGLSIITILGLLGVLYYVVTINNTLNKKITGLTTDMYEQLNKINSDTADSFKKYKIENATSASTNTQDKAPDVSRFATQKVGETKPSPTDYEFSYANPVRVDLFELGSKVIPLGAHDACYITGINESGGPDSACFISTSHKGSNTWQLEVISAICSAQCIDLVKSPSESRW